MTGLIRLKCTICLLFIYLFVIFFDTFLVPFHSDNNHIRHHKHTNQFITSDTRWNMVRIVCIFIVIYEKLNHSNNILCLCLFFTSWWAILRWILFILMLCCLVSTHIIAWRIKTAIKCERTNSFNNKPQTLMTKFGKTIILNNGWIINTLMQGQKKIICSPGHSFIVWIKLKNKPCEKEVFRLLFLCI